MYIAQRNGLRSPSSIDVRTCSRHSQGESSTAFFGCCYDSGRNRKLHIQNRTPVYLCDVLCSGDVLSSSQRVKVSSDNSSFRSLVTGGGHSRAVSEVRVENNDAEWILIVPQRCCGMGSKLNGTQVGRAKQQYNDLKQYTSEDVFAIRNTTASDLEALSTTYAMCCL